MLILGISAGFHDAAAAVVVDGNIVSAVEQERLTRRKHDASFPGRAMDVALAVAGADPGDVDLVVHHERPIAVLDRHVATRLRNGPAGLRSLLLETPTVARVQLGVGHRVSRWFADRGESTPPLAYADHHLSHAAASFYPSPFDEAAVLTLDGVGEWATATRGKGCGAELVVDGHVDFPDSIGLLYSAFTEYCGFRPNSGEGELMGLAPFGEPAFRDLILDELIDLADDGSFRLDMRYFAFPRGRRMTARRFHQLMGGGPQELGADPGQRQADLAASIQQVLEEVLLRMARSLRSRTGSRSLCLGGGVALNCVANGLVLAAKVFDDVWVPPAAGDAGGAVGAALWGHHDILGGERSAASSDGMSGAFLGPAFSSDEVRAWLTSAGVEHRVIADVATRDDEIAQRLDAGDVVGWFTGRMEFGPRALGHRSIVADPRSPTVQRRLNAMVKERAVFRPFAPAVLSEHVDEWFDLSGDRPYMNFVAHVLPEHQVESAPGDDEGDLEARVQTVRSVVPAVTHVDRSARVQTVDAGRNPEFAGLIEAFRRRTGCPILLNTSFNARDEPIVCSPADALATFRRTGLDLLVLENCIVEAER